MTTTPGEFARGEDLVRARLAVATEAAGLGLWDWDLETDALVWDTRSIAIFGLTGQPLTGRITDIRRGIHPDDVPGVEQALGAAIERVGRLDVEFRVRWPDGSIHWVSALGQVLPDHTGRPMRVIGTNADVTDTRRVAHEQIADAQRMAGLIAVAEALGGAQTVPDVLAVVARHAATVLGTTGLILCLTEDDASPVTTLVHSERGSPVLDRLTRLPRDHPLPMVDSAVNGRAHFVPDLATAERDYPGGADLWRRSGTRSGCSVPLWTPARLLGSLALGYRTDREWRPADREFIGALASLTAQTLSRIRSAADAAEAAGKVARLAETLQRAMLTAPPEPDHLQVVTRYLPAAAEAQVGGDWYDAFLGPDGATHLVIGDVTGHDREAAATMGQLRNVLRGIAWASGGTPAQVLADLDRAIAGLDIGALATVLVGRVEQGEGDRPAGRRTLRWSNAGHPPPLLADPAGVVSLLDHRDLLLGVDPTRARTDRTVVLEPGSTLLLYTDGLIERRDADLDAGTARLGEAVGRLVADGVPLAELCDRVLAGLEGRRDDDVALIALRAHPEQLPRPVEAGPIVVPDGVDGTAG